MLHTVDILHKTKTYSDAGQKVATWSVAESAVRCSFIPQFNDSRNLMSNPVYSSNEIISFFFDGNTSIDYSYRLQNIKDKFGNIIESGPIEITSIIKVPGYTGKLHHIEVSGQRVTDN